MTYEEHGLSIGTSRVGDNIYLKFKAIGKLTHHDYEIIIPMLEEALKEVKDPKVKALIDATELEGWELRAAWDDLKLGLKHGKEFTKIAIIGNKHWEEAATKMASWFMSGETEYFENYNAAIDWLQA